MSQSCVIITCITSSTDGTVQTEDIALAPAQDADHYYHIFVLH